ncbi:prepilin-type N-terminal cleavage/methylation domain-containing protein [Candidatus Saccharibacteria bacterium]|nr:prepilin-type N-terminal cleavage/methylation domain-containing protein [Candidatus Saccharibacteria bacterium]
MTTKNKKGFTIIEVVLVLAIAGLIFLMVFIALPALQRSQRNTQREDDLARIITGVNNYQTNNNGKVPFREGATGTELATFVQRYIDKNCKTVKTVTTTNGSGDSATTQSWTTFESCGDSNEFRDPQGNIYKIASGGKAVTTTGSGDSTSTTAGKDVANLVAEESFLGFYNATCGDEGHANGGTGDRDVAVFMKLEGGAIACNDNH